MHNPTSSFKIYFHGLLFSEFWRRSFWKKIPVLNGSASSFVRLHSKVAPIGNFFHTFQMSLPFTSNSSLERTTTEYSTLAIGTKCDRVHPGTGSSCPGTYRCSAPSSSTCTQLVLQHCFSKVNRLRPTRYIRATIIHTRTQV